MARPTAFRKLGSTYGLLVVSMLAICMAGTVAAQPVSDRPPTAQGVTGEGALYGFWVPREWNGDLVVYAHGVIEPGRPLAIPTTQDSFYVYRDAWLDRHFAVAASSYAENGWAIQDAVQKTHQLKGLFAETFGAPRRTFLFGHSLGALAITKIAERHGSQYAGAMPVCGTLGGALRELEYARDGRLLFDYFFPGVLPGTVFDVPELSPTEIVAYAQAAANAAVAGFVTGDVPKQAATLQWLSTSHVPYVPFGPPAPIQLTLASIANSAATIAYFSLTYTNDLLGRVQFRIPVDNLTTQYAGSFNDALLNAQIQRYAAEPSAINYYRRNYEPTGRLDLPTLAVHTSWDPVAPAVHETDYAQTVDAAGAANRLVTRVYGAYGHCDPEMFGLAPYDPGFIAATLRDFDDLVAWAGGGPKPASLP